MKTEPHWIVITRQHMCASCKREIEKGERCWTYYKPKYGPAWDCEQCKSEE